MQQKEKETTPSKKQSRALVTLGLAMLLFAGGTGLGFLYGKSIASTALAEKETRPLFAGSLQEDKIAEIRDTIHEQFLFDIDEVELTNGIYRGIADSLGDIYTSYYTEEESLANDAISANRRVGIGVRIMFDEKMNYCFFKDLYADGSAKKAGIAVGDYLLAANGVSMANLPVDTIAEKYVLGEENTTITLHCARKETYEPYTVTVRREAFQQPATSYKMLAQNTGYVTVSGFTAGAYSEFVKAIDTLQTDGMQGLVIDLRNNLGGYMLEALSMVAYLTDEDSFVRSDGKLPVPLATIIDKHNERMHYFTIENHSIAVPIVVLLNESSASASELLAGALRDYGDAILVGETSFGKGIVQNKFLLKDKSAIKMTTGNYLTPSDFALHGIGLTPDIQVSLNQDVDFYGSEKDNQLNTALSTIADMKAGTIKPAYTAKNMVPSAPPAAFLDAVAKNPCEATHFAFTRAEIDQLVPEMILKSKYGILTMEDNFSISDSGVPQWVYEISTFIGDGSLETEDTSDIYLNIDPLTRQVHSLSVKTSPALATQYAVYFLQKLAPEADATAEKAMSIALSALQETPNSQDRQEMISGKGYCISATWDATKLDILIEATDGGFIK